MPQNTYRGRFRTAKSIEDLGKSGRSVGIALAPYRQWSRAELAVYPLVYPPRRSNNYFNETEWRFMALFRFKMIKNG
jgi:hypothetical protein